MTRDEIDELVEGLSHNIKVDFEYWPLTRHGIVIIGGMFGFLTFMVLKLVQLLMRALIPQNISGTGLTLVAILFSMAGGLILPSVRVMQSEEALLQELPDDMRLDLRFYATAFMALTLVYPSVERTLRGKWVQR